MKQYRIQEIVGLEPMTKYFESVKINVLKIFTVEGEGK